MGWKRTVRAPTGCGFEKFTDCYSVNHSSAQSGVNRVQGAEGRLEADRKHRATRSMAIDRTASTFASTASTPVEAPFGFADFLRVLDERRSLIRNIMLAVSALTLLVLLYLPTLYSSSAVVMLDQRKNNVADLSSVLSALPTDPSSVQNQIQVLSSRELAGRVIGKLKLYDDPEFDPALNGNATPDIGDLVRLLNPANWGSSRRAGADYERDAIVSAFLRRLDVSALGLSTSITVTFASRDPAKAALIANTLADTYTEDQVDTEVAAARKATNG